MRRLIFPLLLLAGVACAASGEGDDGTPTEDSGVPKKDSGVKDTTTTEEDSASSEKDATTKSDSAAKDAGAKDTSVKDSSKPDTNTTPDTGPILLDAGSAAPGTALTINEIDYDQINLDTAEFVELFNPTASPIDVTGYQLVFYNGALKSVVEYGRVSLTGTVPAGGYLVVGAAGLTIDPGASKIDLALSSNNIQNGDPDGVALFDAAGGKLDSVSYGGIMQGITEGATAAPVDSNTTNGSIIRSPNAADTNDNGVDWKFTTTITAGKANVTTP